MGTPAGRLRIVPLVTLATLLVHLAPDVRALSRDERALVARSLRDGERRKVEDALGPGGLDALPFTVIELELDLEARTVKGHVRLDWPNRTGGPITELPIRLSPNGDGSDTPLLRASNVRIVNAKGGTLARTRKEHHGLLFVTLPAPLANGARVVVDLELSGYLPQLADDAIDPALSSLAMMMSGGSVSVGDGRQYGTFACASGICTLAGFAPTVPAFIDGAFDLQPGSGIGDATYAEPMNAIFAVVAPASVTLAATGVEVGRIPAGEGKRRTTFAIAAARELGIVASERFVVATQVVDGVTVRSFALEEDAEAGRRALKAGAQALRVFDKALGRYPWATLDIAESGLTGGAGGVELPALALGAAGVYREPSGLAAMVDPQTFRDILEFVTRHEVAHQWWHAQVGSHAQRHPFIDEPLAQWSALLATRRASRQAADRVKELQLVLQYQAARLFGVEDGPVARPAGDFVSATEYAALVYGKAPLFYEALAKEIGEAAVLAALRGLVQKARFGRITPDELRTTLVRAAGGKGARVLALWRRWFDEAHGDEDVGGVSGLMLGGMHAGGGLGSLQGLGGLGGAAGGMPSDMSPEQAMKLMRELMKELKLEDLLEEMEER